MTCSISYVAAGAGLLLATVNAPLARAASVTAVASQVQSLQELPVSAASVKVPSIEEPEWLKKQKAAEAAASRRASSSGLQVVTYEVSGRGVADTGMAEFRAQANQTLNDARGWAQLGVAFQEVDSGGMFTLVLSAADQMTSFSSGCSAEYSCRVGRSVIINQDRWLNASSAWNQGGGTLRDYRHTVVNHEVGHWLGHDHATCDGPGQPAKVMQQQSIDLQGCTISSWPAESELWSTTLGINR